MSVLLSLALQAVPIRTEFDLARVRPIDFDLRRLRGAQCAPSADSAIIVCGRRPSPGYPLEAMERLFAPRRIVAQTSLGGNVTGRAFVESAPMDRGAVSNRIMFGIKMPF